MSYAMQGIQMGEADNEDGAADFDLYSRLQLIRFLSEINTEDETTKDEFFIDVVKNFTGNSMKDLLPHYIQTKGERLRQIALMGVTAHPFQLELFHRSSLQPSNSIIHVPSRCGKSLVAYMAVKYLMQQYADKKVIFLAPTPTEVVLHGLTFLEMTSAPRNTVGLVTTLENASPQQIKEAKVIFTTMALYLEMLTSKAILLHHCSLLVLDEVQLSLKSREYVEFYHTHWYEEMVQFRPRILGLLGAQIETLEIAPWTASLEELSKKWDAEVYTCVFLPELAHIQRISWFGERQFTSCDDIPPLDATVSAAVSEYIKSAVSILISLHQALLTESTRLNPNATSPYSTSTSYPELQPYPSSSYYNELLFNLSTLRMLVTSGDQEFSLQSRISPLFSRFLTRLVIGAPTSIMRLIAKHILSAWEALESVYIFGASFSLPLLRSLVDILQPDDEASYMPIYRTFIFQLNSEKETLDRVMRTVNQSSQPTGRAASMLASIRNYPGTPKIWVIVQNEATADRVTDFLSQKLPLAADVGSLGKQSSHVISKYKSGECRILVVPFKAEMEQIQNSEAIPSAHFIIHLDGPQTCRSLISNRLLSDSVSPSATNIFIGSPEEMEALSVLAAEDQFIFATVRSFCDPEGVERDDVDVEEDFEKYYQLATQRVHGPLLSITPTIAPKRPNPATMGHPAAIRPPMGSDNFSHPFGMSNSFSSSMHVASPHPPAFPPHGGMHEGYAPSGHFGPGPSQSQFYYPPQAYPPSGTSAYPPTVAPSPMSHPGLNQAPYGMPHPFSSVSPTPPIGADAHTPASSSLGSASGVNYVGKLQEYFQKSGQPLPQYDEISGGHGTNHFVQECSVAGKKARGEGQTKKAAKTDSAYNMLRLLRIIK